MPQQPDPPEDPAPVPNPDHPPTPAEMPPRDMPPGITTPEPDEVTEPGEPLGIPPSYPSELAPRSGGTVGREELDADFILRAPGDAAGPVGPPGL